MIQELLYLIDENKERCFSNPPVVVRENKRAPLVGFAGIVPVRDLIDRLNVASTIDSHVSVFKRHNPYFESDHILNFVYNFLTGGEVINDIERMQQSEGLLRILGSERMPDPTTAGDFLVRFGEQDIGSFQTACERIQDEAFSLLNKKRKQQATIEHDSSIHEVYGEKKEGADYAYNNTYSYSAQYVTLAETGDVLDQELYSGNRYSSFGFKERLPHIIDRVASQFTRVRYRADSASYDKEIVEVCDGRGVSFYISGAKTSALMRQVLGIEEGSWKSFRQIKLSNRGKRKTTARRKKRKNHKKAVRKKRKPHAKRRGKTQIASIEYQPSGWDKPYRFVVKRTEVLDEYGQQCLEEHLCKYIYHIIVTNDLESSDCRAMCIAQARANQENLIKDFKYGLGLSHVPTGFFLANRIYFKIAALAWNIKTWMLNLLSMGDGAVLRFKRFLYLWIHHACIVSKTARNTVVIYMDPGEYFTRYSKALDAIAEL